ncbi:hypothetical protein CDAR_62211 [Caerostris darwini]|uniref:Uncharacterized protein n=1 Tax=Caerostris darwini TaxID=1538125 RepID=A0AAV4MVT8_9ARAC|nr:hypothetical protein CDAR_62211 [Caerostris darwini]
MRTHDCGNAPFSTAVAINVSESTKWACCAHATTESSEVIPHRIFRCHEYFDAFQGEIHNWKFQLHGFLNRLCLVCLRFPQSSDFDICWFN